VLFELARPLKALAHRLERGDTACREEAAELAPRWQELVELAGVLGLIAETQARDMDEAAAGEDSEEAAILERIAERQAAKAARDFATADRIRAELQQQGVELIDKPGGVTDWMRR
jgi:cysteinyl-tRNA synthetase